MPDRWSFPRMCTKSLGPLHTQTHTHTQWVLSLTKLFRCERARDGQSLAAKSEQNKTKTKQNKTKQNKTKQNKTKQNKTKQKQIYLRNRNGASNETHAHDRYDMCHCKSTIEIIVTRIREEVILCHNWSLAFIFWQDITVQ